MKENKKNFWKGVSEVRKGESLRSLSMRNSMGEKNDNEGRWKEYFVKLLNGKEIREEGGNVRRGRIGENERGEGRNNGCTKVDERW